MKATRIKGLYEVGSVEPFPLTPEHTDLQQLGFSKYPYGDLFAHCHAPFSELVRQTFPNAWHPQLFNNASWLNPQAQLHHTWHQDGIASMLLAILTKDESAGTEFSSCSKTISLSRWHGQYGSSWDYDSMLMIYLQAEYITKPWTLYLITRNLYHRIRERKQDVFRVMLREHAFNYELDYPNLGVLW